MMLPTLQKLILEYVYDFLTWFILIDTVCLVVTSLAAMIIKAVRLTKGTDEPEDHDDVRENRDFRMKDRTERKGKRKGNKRKM